MRFSVGGLRIFYFFFLFLRGGLPRFMKPESISLHYGICKSKMCSVGATRFLLMGKMYRGRRGKEGGCLRYRQWMQSEREEGKKSVPLCNKDRFSLQYGK